MHPQRWRLLAVGFAIASAPAFAFNSGSTGADGAFNPSVSAVVPLPASGVFNYTTVTIPAGVTITFQKNAANTPVVILAQGAVTIAGTLSVSGTASPPTGTQGNGNILDDGNPGIGGPGGFDGGAGHLTERGSDGLGPGGGTGGPAVPGMFGSGGGFGANGGAGGRGTNPPYCGNATIAGGSPYGSASLIPLLGGSGGGGGYGGTLFKGSGGGGGGGSILIASSGTITVTGSVRADGGASGASQDSGADEAGSGGGGSGGAIRMVATAIAGGGTISAAGGAASPSHSFTGSSGVGCTRFSGAGSVGRIRLEAETLTFSSATIPPYAFGATGALFAAGLPTLAITSVGGFPVPASPTGSGDITLPNNQPNPVTVTMTTSGVPVGSVITLTVTPAGAAHTTVDSPPTTGTNESATASVDATIPTGSTILVASTSFTVVASLGNELSRFAQGEQVEKVTLSSTLGGRSKMLLTTKSGRNVEVFAALMATGG